MYSRQFHDYLKKNGFSEKAVDGEDEYMQKWSQLSKRVEPWSYRFFSHYCGKTPYIIPEDIGRTMIEAKLNNARYSDYYSDKNLYPTYIPDNAVPRTLVCRIDGSVLLDEEFKPLQSPLDEILVRYDKLILKPSVDSDSGRGVMLFKKIGTQWCYAKDDKITLTTDFLLRYGKDFVLQEALTQHPDLAALNESSINTLRVAVYRSVKDEQSHVVSAIIRIGKKNEFVDNAHAGGRFVGIDVATGKLANEVLDQYGNISTEWNGIDYSKTTHIVPHWDEVKAFACKATSRLHHARLIAFDLSVDANGHPKMVEFNINGFSYWLFMYTKQNPLGDFTDEIIEYCKEH